MAAAGRNPKPPNWTGRIYCSGQGVGMEAHQLSEGSMDTSIKSMEAITTKACSHTFSATGEAQQVVPDLGIPVGTAGPAVMMALLQCLGSRLHSHFQIQFLCCRRRSDFGLVGPGPRQRAPSREGKREREGSVWESTCVEKHQAAKAAMP